MIQRSDFDEMTLTAVDRNGQSCAFKFADLFEQLLKERDEALANAEALDRLYYPAHRKSCSHSSLLDCQIEVDDLAERILSERKQASDAKAI